jgi:hypothetical protein
MYKFNWFLMMPSIATKFQYVNSPFFIFLLTHYKFRPLRAILKCDVQLMFPRTIISTTDPLYLHNLTYVYIGISTRGPQYLLSNVV